MNSRRSLLVASVVAVGCTMPKGEGTHAVSESVTCNPTDGCKSQKTEVHAAPSPSLAELIHDNGEGLPSSIDEAGYQKILDATHVHITGRYSASVGPAAVFAGRDLSPDHVAVVLAIAPLPNLELMAEQLGHEPRLIVSKVLAKDGSDVLDHENTFVKDPMFELLRLSEDEPLGMPTSDSHQTKLETIQLPGESTHLLYAMRSVALRRPLTDGEPVSIEGQVVLALPAGVSIASPALGSAQQVDGVSVTATREDDKLHTVITGDMARFIEQRARSKDGIRLANNDCSQSVPEAEKTKKNVDCTYDSEPSSVQVAIAKKLIEEKYAFKLVRDTP